MKTDFHVYGGGSIYMLEPLTPAAKAWVEENLPADRQTLGNAVAVEHRYIGGIVAGARQDGLTVA